MIRSVLDVITETSWRDWIATLAEFAGVAVIVVSIAMLAVAVAPDLTQQ